MPKEKNRAYIDGQNLYLGTKAARWQVDFTKFRIYLKDKYQVTEAYYFMWYVDENEEKLYTHLQEAWFIIVFREHTANLKGKKKGNVDVDIVFEMMRAMHEKDDFDKIVLVSGDGDYIKPVKYFIEKGLFKKILFPNKNYSSLYKQIQDRFSVNISVKDIKMKIAHISKKKITKKPTSDAIATKKKKVTKKNKQQKKGTA